MRRQQFKHWTGSIRSCPLSPGRAERHGFEYYRHGTLSLYAALDTKTGMLVRAAQASDIADRVRTPKEFLDLSTVIAQYITVRSKSLFVHRSSRYRSYRTPACRYCVFRRTPS